jgi:hypothetical protein
MNNAKGGVTPLKKRGGKAARKVTAKATGKGVVSGYKGRGGYKKSGGGKNPGGYNVHTRFKPRAKQEGPKGGGGSTDPTSNKPYSFDENGDIIINNSNYINTTGGTDNKNENINTNINKNENINTNKSNEQPENDQINDELLTRYETEDGTTKETTSMQEETDTGYRAVWNGYSKRGGKLVQRSERYKTSGQGLQFDPNSSNTNKNGVTAKEFFKEEFGRIKGGNIIHNNFEEYEAHQLKLIAWEKSGGERITSSSSRKSYKKVTKIETSGGKTWKITYRASDGKEVSRVQVNKKG